MTFNFQRITKQEILLSGIRNILAFGDIGCTGFDDDSKKVLGKLLSYKPDLFFVLGDLTCAGAKEEFDEVIDFCKERTTKPIFALRGNHDASGYSKCLGMSDYAIIVDHFLCLFIDNSKSHIDKKTVDFLHSKLEKYRDKKVIIFFHIPPPLTFNTMGMNFLEWYKLRKVMDYHRERIECIVCGHVHGFYEYTIDDYHIFITAGGGAKMIYEMPPGGFKIHNALKMSFDNDTVAINLIPVAL